MNLLTDFSAAWVRDGGDNTEKWYELYIDGDEHHFSLSYDAETETYDETLLEYDLPTSALEDRSWELVKQ